MNQETTRREALLLVATGVGALAVGGTAGAQAAPPAPAGHGVMMSDCAAECEKANRACLETLRYCLEKGGKYTSPAHVQLLLDCAEICQMTANFMSRGSAAHGVACDACAEVCERCAESCETFSGDSRMTACAKTCRTCAKSCREMAKM